MALAPELFIGEKPFRPGQDVPFEVFDGGHELIEPSIEADQFEASKGILQRLNRLFRGLGHGPTRSQFGL